MEFPISELLDRESSLEWLARYFHPDGMRCPGCGRDNFLRPFKGVHKKYLAGYVAFAEFKRNLKAIRPN